MNSPAHPAGIFGLVSPVRADGLGRKILAQSGYQNGGQSIAERLWGDVTRFFGHLLSSIASAGGYAGTVVAAVLAVAAVVAIAVLAVRFVLERRSMRVSTHGAGSVEPGVDEAGWLALASEAEERGAWAEVLRCRYRAAVWRLSSLGLVDDLPGRTCGELKDQLTRTSPETGPAFREIANAFELAFFGGVDAGPAQASRQEQNFAGLPSEGGMLSGLSSSWKRRLHGEAS